MNQAPEMSTADPVFVPQARTAPMIERLLWVFMLSFALDYRASEARASGAGMGADQLVFMSLCAGSTFGITWLGRRHLMVRPGAWLIALWLAFLVFMVANAFLQGVDPTRSLRISLPLFLCLAGLVNAHVAGCAGITAERIVRPVFAAACINILWRIGHGFIGKGVSLATVRTEVQSPAANWLSAWIGCAILLRSRFHWSLLLACGVLFTGVIITVTRSLLFPVAASAVAASLCFLLGVRWRLYDWRDFPSRLLPVGAATLLAIIGLGLAAAASPALLDRWNERLFHHASDRNLSADISWLTRRAEADGIREILLREPVHFIHGRGIGASYHWSHAYQPEILLVFPKELETGHEVWFAGHSVWTYALFSGGGIALLAYLGLIGGTMASSLRAARANASDPGPDQWLVFLPFVAACCLLSESLTSNPFDERLAGMTFGMMAGLSQAFMVRASWIHAARLQPS